MKLKMQTFISTSGSSRFTFYETWFNKTVAIVKEELWEEVWSITSVISLPKTIFNMLEYETNGDETTSSSQLDQHAETPFTAKVIDDRFLLPLKVREALFEIDCQNIPWSENQMGCMNDLETLEWYWNIATTPESPEKVAPCSLPVLEVKSETYTCKTPFKSELSSVRECPPAPKKSKRYNLEKPDFRVVPLDLTDLWNLVSLLYSWVTVKVVLIGSFLIYVFWKLNIALLETWVTSSIFYLAPLR